MIMTMACVAFCVDLGYLSVARTELQRSADAAAMAAAWELVDEELLQGTPSLDNGIDQAREKAQQYAAQNRVCSRQPSVDANAGNDPDGDIVIGTVWNLSDHSEPISFGDPTDYNVVQVRVRRDSVSNGNVPFFFAPVLGIKNQPSRAQATAGLVKNISGFRAPARGGDHIGILPFALDIDTWNALLAQQTPDDWTWDPQTKTITPGPDGVHEVNLYPQGTGSPGNRGTVDIGSSNNSTNDIARQILDGISPDELQYHGGTLELDENGELLLNGDTGISAGVKDELASIKGQPRIIPIFSQVVGPGNNAEYTIVMFVGVRILDVKLTGSMNSKRVIIQPANVVTKGVIPAPSQEPTSHFVYSYPILIR
jgi:hypothetical protein